MSTSSYRPRPNAPRGLLYRNADTADIVHTREMFEVLFLGFLYIDKITLGLYVGHTNNKIGFRSEQRFDKSICRYL